ncbi:MAG TPA: homoserine O-succinyltransferase, partial [Geminicoccaceae bacterium]|nr:homoserine O-succinyltransferase [Geminicoccaceae bacterium]
MPIELPDGLPARRLLQEEGVEVIGGAADGGRRGWGMRPPLRIALLNLMPTKAATETQFARLLGSTPFPVALTLVVPDSYEPRTTPAEHISAFYERWSRVRHERFDAMIVTGAPVETLPFEEVAYWRELTRIMDWARERVRRTYYVCWGAQAALHHFHGVPKHALGEKMFGVFRHRVAARPGHPLFRGFGAEFVTPVSRHTEVRAADLPRDAGLEVLADSPEAGLCLVEDRARGALYNFNHLEYDAGTLRDEYLRDVREGGAIRVPRHYFPGDDPERPPVDTWRPFAHLLFRNWLGEMARSAAAADGA